MGLKTMSLINAATVAFSGGTPFDVRPDGLTVQNGLHLIVPGDTDYLTRRTVTAKYRPPTFDSKTGAYGKDKKSLTLVVPLTVGDRTVFCTLRLEREVHPSMSAGVAAEINKLGAQLLCDADVESFWATGSME